MAFFWAGGPRLRGLNEARLYYGCNHSSLGMEKY